MRWAVGSAEEMGEQVDTIERPARLDTSHSLCEGRGGEVLAECHR